MPIEAALLKDQPEIFEKCPSCDYEPFASMMRGQVHNGWRDFFKKPYCCVICHKCGGIVGYEKPPELHQAR